MCVFVLKWPPIFDPSFLVANSTSVSAELHTPSGTQSSVASGSSIDFKCRFPIPSAIRIRRKGMQGHQSMKAPTCYVRDIMCLPRSFRSADSGNVSIPRTEKRSANAEAGLIGKVEFRST